MLPTLQKAIDVYRAEGMTRLIGRTGKRILRAFLETNSATWYGRDLRAGGNATRRRPDLIVDFSSFSDALEWMKGQKIPWLLHPDELDVAVRENHSWTVIRLRSAIAGTMKIGFGNVFIRDYRRTVTFPPGVAYIYDTFVAPEYRGEGVASCSIEEACGRLRERGYGRVLCHIPDWNVPSIRAYGNAGFRRIRSIRFVRIAGVEIMTGDPATC